MTPLRLLFLCVGCGIVLALMQKDSAAQVKKKDDPVPVGRIKMFKGHDGPVNAVTFFPDGQRLISVSNDGSARLWDLTAEKKSSVLLNNMKVKPKCVVFMPKLATGPKLVNGKLVFTDGGDDPLKVYLWDPTTKRAIRSYGDCGNGVRSIAVSKDGKYVAAGTGGGKYLVWEIQSAKLVREFDAKIGECLSVAFMPDSKRIVCVGDDTNSIRMYELASGKLLTKFKIKDSDSLFVTIRVTPDGKKIVVACHDGMIRILDAEERLEPIILSGHRNHAHAVDISPDGTLIASGGIDKTVRIWDIQQGMEIHKFDGHEGEVYCVVFSPDGKRVASCGRDEHVRVWGLGK